VPEPRAHLSAQRLQAVKRPDHDLEIDDEPLAVELNEINAF